MGVYSENAEELIPLRGVNVHINKHETISFHESIYTENQRLPDFQRIPYYLGLVA